MTATEDTRAGCVKPVGHQGRCRDRFGRSWENNHPPLMRHDAVQAIRVLIGLPSVDDPGPGHWADAEAAAAVLAPLVGEKP